MEPQEIKQEAPEERDLNEKKTSSISVPYAIITAGVVIALAIFMSKGHGTVPTTPTKQVEGTAVTTPLSDVTVSSSDFIRGDMTKAKVVIVEYSDSDCPFCQRFHETMETVRATYGEKVAWVYRFFPLSIHPNANNEALALECVGELGGNETFWKYLDQLINITVTPEQSASILASTAKDLGIDGKLLSTCLSNPQTSKKIEAQSVEAQMLGGQGTPFSIAIAANGQRVAIPGAYPIEDMKKIIDGLLK